MSGMPSSADQPRRPGSGETAQRADTIPVVTVRYWAGARAAAGVEAEQLSGATVAEVMDAAVRAHPRLRGVIPVSSVLQNGRAVAPAADVVPGAVLEVLPPFAGG